MPVRPSCLSVPFVFVSGSSGCLSKRRAWRLFMIADAWASFVRLVGRGADEREKGTRRPRSIPGYEPGTRGPRGKRQADRSDVRQEYARLKRARSGFEPGQANGRQPFMPRVSHSPCLLLLPFRFAHARRMRPLSVGRLDNAFHPAMDDHHVIPILCKAIAAMAAMMVNRKGYGRRLSHWWSGDAPESYAWRPRPSAGQTAGIKVTRATRRLRALMPDAVT